MSWPFRRLRPRPQPKSETVHDPKGQRLMGLSLETNEPIWAPKGHSLLLSAAGGGKTSCGSMVWLFSYAASEPHKAVLVLDSKNGEHAVQAADMLARIGRKVAIIDETGELPADCPHRVSLNPLGPALWAKQHRPETLLYAIETINHALIAEPAESDDRKVRKSVV